MPCTCAIVCSFFASQRSCCELLRIKPIASNIHTWLKSYTKLQPYIGTVLRKRSSSVSTRLWRWGQRLHQRLTTLSPPLGPHNTHHIQPMALQECKFRMSRYGVTPNMLVIFRASILLPLNTSTHHPNCLQTPTSELFVCAGPAAADASVHGPCAGSQANVRCNIF